MVGRPLFDIEVFLVSSFTFSKTGFLQLGFVSMGVEVFLGGWTFWQLLMDDSPAFMTIPNSLFNVSVTERRDNYYSRSLFIQDHQILIKYLSKPTCSNTRRLV